MVLRHLIRPYLLISCILEKIISNMVTAMYREDGLGFLHDSRRLNHEASDTLLVIPDKDTTLGQISVSTTLAQGGKLDPENEALNIREPLQAQQISREDIDETTKAPIVQKYPKLRLFSAIYTLLASQVAGANDANDRETPST